MLKAGLPTTPQRRWNKVRIIRAIQQRHAAGELLCRTWREDKPLFRAAVTWFGNWEPAMVAAGFDPIRRERWSKQRVIERLQVWRERTRETNLRQSAPNLAGAASRLFGSLEVALKVADVVGTPRHWTDERVIEEIQQRYVRGQPKHIQGLGDIRLALAAKRRFGSWANAVAVAGLADRIPIAKPFRRRTKQQVIDSIQLAVRDGVKLSAISSRDQGLYNAAKTHFGTWTSAVSAAGLPTTRRQWNKQVIIAEIRDRQRRNKSLSCNSRENVNLAAAAHRHFGSWSNALIEAGVKNKFARRRDAS